MAALANLVAAVHLIFFCFVAGGFLAMMIGAMRKQVWIYNPWFRISHLLAVLVVPAEDMFRFNCPLNVMESSLRAGRSDASMPGKILDFLLRHTIPGQVLDGMYWTLGAVLIVLLFVLRPSLRARSAAS